MSLKYFIVPTALAVALALSAVPASAQHAGGGFGAGRSGGGHAGGGHYGGPHPGGGHAQVGHGPYSGGAPRGPGSFDHRGMRFHDGRGFNGPLVHVRVIRPFREPFFTFRPRFNLGFGFFVGYPVAYPWDDIAPYPYPDPYVVDPDGSAYGDSDDAVAATVPSDERQNYGGISFDVAPGDATVLVDGTHVGTVQTFSPSSAPLTLVAGRHHLVVQKPGYQPISFDVDVVAGQVVPYQGTMQPE